MPTEIKYTDPAPLSTFRIFFGLLMFVSIVRFWAKGWIEKLYIEPSFHFKYYGFSWVDVPQPIWLYFLFAICGLSALLVAIGFKYRLSMIVFFLTFTYIELMDKTTYLNHYYFISILSFLLIFIPAASHFSYDAWKGKGYSQVPRFYVNVLKLLLAIVYIYAGLAKLNYDWMVKALPLSIWLPSKYSIPLIGDLLQKTWVHYLFSWAGAFYDLFIVFFLLYKPTRVVAYITVVIFHLLTGILFPIGMFPYVMIVSTLIFFPPEFHKKIINFIARLLGLDSNMGISLPTFQVKPRVRSIIILFFLAQIFIPIRFLAYPGNLFWTEEGYRFSWRVMLIEKAGYAQFRIADQDTNSEFVVDNSDFLTTFQEKQMATQADFILEYAHYLGKHFKEQGHQNIAIFVDSFVALNGAKSKRFIDPSVNLMKIEDSFSHKNWILPFND